MYEWLIAFFSTILLAYGFSSRKIIYLWASLIGYIIGLAELTNNPAAKPASFWAFYALIGGSIAIIMLATLQYLRYRVKR